eukprot:gnl/Trimastix_PCT/1896.p1 GENE.gnl/Trimastix_PCT/1896~~gnl/Trimastix_PCT/1896.p1  ORF type:complete len:698 (+),score=144.60 gnl/Trimastix_PCT/1896:88-2181(+)
MGSLCSKDANRQPASLLEFLATVRTEAMDHQGRVALQHGVLVIHCKKGTKGKRLLLGLNSEVTRLHLKKKKGKKLVRDVALNDISELREGQTTTGFHSFQHLPSDRSFSLVIGDSTLDLVIVGEEEGTNLYQSVVAALQACLRTSGVDPFWLFLKRKWVAADSDHSGMLDYQEIASLVDSLNLKIPRAVLEKKLAEVDLDHNGQLDFDEFSLLINQLRSSTHIRDLFNATIAQALSLPDDAQQHFRMPPEAFHHFLTQIQGDSISFEVAKSQIATLEPTAEGLLSLQGFTDYLLNPEMNDWYRTEMTGSVYQDMTRPITEYYCASSHNTYLAGNQLTGTSSVEMYVKTLRQGVRCVELDCWDGSDGQPIIFHGHTLTSKILFADVVRAIRDNAFVASEYPVILSIENHCSTAQQDRMAEVFLEVLGAAGMLPDIPAPGEPLPSPEQLKRKVLLKGKKSPSLTSAPSEAPLDIAVTPRDTPTDTLTPTDTDTQTPIDLGHLPSSQPSSELSLHTQTPAPTDTHPHTDTATQTPTQMEPGELSPDGSSPQHIDTDAATHPHTHAVPLKRTQMEGNEPRCTEGSENSLKRARMDLSSRSSSHPVPSEASHDIPAPQSAHTHEDIQNPALALLPDSLPLPREASSPLKRTRMEASSPSHPMTIAKAPGPHRLAIWHVGTLEPIEPPCEDPSAPCSPPATPK